MVTINTWEFFHEYLDSDAFEDEASFCMHNLAEVNALPPEVVTHVAQRLISLFRRDLPKGAAQAFRFAHKGSVLVIRLYRQTHDEKLKIQCLNLIDEMIALGWNEAAVELSKAE